VEGQQKTPPKLAIIKGEEELKVEKFERKYEKEAKK